MLFLAAAAAVLSVVPAMAQNGQVFDWAAQDAAYSNSLPRDNAKQCFDGKFIAGMTRAGDQTLYVQSTKRGIYRLRMADDCAALNAARKLTVRSHGSDMVCPGEAAETVAWTPAGVQHCEVSDVQRLTAREVSAISTAGRP